VTSESLALIVDHLFPAQEIADDLQTALEQFTAIAEKFKSEA